MAEANVFYEGPVVTRDEAKAAGEKRYFSGVPCTYGHVAQRKTVNGGCLACHNETQKRYEQTDKRKAGLEVWYAENAERRKIQRKIYKDERREEILAYNAAYRAENKERIAEYNRLAYLADTDKFLARCADRRAKTPGYMRIYYHSNKPKMAAHRQARRARVRAAGGKFTGEQIQKMLGDQKWKCIYCGKSLKHGYHVDHKLPLVRGGSNDISNIQICCPKCNCTKRDRDDIEYAQIIGRLL